MPVPKRSYFIILSIPETLAAIRGREVKNVTLETDATTDVHGQLKIRYLFQKPAHIQSAVRTTIGFVVFKNVFLELATALTKTMHWIREYIKIRIAELVPIWGSERPSDFCSPEGVVIAFLELGFLKPEPGTPSSGRGQGFPEFWFRQGESKICDGRMQGM